MAGAQHRPGAPDVVTAGAPLRDGDGGSVPSVRERLGSRDLAVKVFVAGVTYVALVRIGQAWAVIGAVMSPVVSDLVRDYVERHHWSLRRLRRGSAATVLLGHEEEAYAARRRAGRGPGGRIPGGLMASAAAVALVTAAIAAAKVHDKAIPNHRLHKPDQHVPVAGPPKRGIELHGATPTADPPLLYWRSVPGAGRYLVYEKGKVVSARTEAQFTDTNAAWGAHTYRVAVEKDGRVGHRSPPYTIVYQRTPPPSSAGIVLSGQSPTTQPPSITWHGSSRADGYVVYRDGRRIDARSTTETSYTDFGVSAGTYAYQVAWIHAGTESLRSATRMIEYRPSVVPPPLHLTPPTGLSGTTPTAEPPSLEWSRVDDATSYDVYRDGVLVGPHTTPPFNDTKASTGPHDYVVRARSGDAASDGSKPYTIDYEPPPQPPVGLQQTSTDGYFPAFDWQNVDGATSYNVYRNGWFVTHVPDNSFEDDGVTGAATYRYTVAAVNKFGFEGKQSKPLDIDYVPPEG